jgi:hypothetical protein
MAGWLELFADRGGKVVYHGVTTSDVDSLTTLYGLVVIAAGKGELVQLFDRDPSRSPHHQRSTHTVRGVCARYDARPEHPTKHAVRFNAVPGVGELFIMPCFTVSGPATSYSLRDCPAVRWTAGRIVRVRPSTSGARSISCASMCRGSTSGVPALN